MHACARLLFDDSDELDPADSEPDDAGFEYIAPVVGRQLGEQNVSRFNIAKLRPFEAVFVDNTDFRMYNWRRCQEIAHLHRLQDQD